MSLFGLQKRVAGVEMVHSNQATFMDSAALFYTTGEEVQVGDRVQYCAKFATVVFVSDGENCEYSTGYGYYAGSDRGLMVCDDDGSLNTVGETDEQLVFVGRA
jgi:hypothetical protein